MKSQSEQSNENLKVSVYETAFKKTARARAAVLPEELQPINLDVPGVVTTVLGAVHRLATLREEIGTKLPETDMKQLDTLETYAKALGFANSEFITASQPPELLPEMLARATQLREILITDATSLSLRGVIDDQALQDLSGETGYLNVGQDLGGLVRLFSHHWSEIVTKTAVTAADLDEAQSLYERINAAVGDRKLAPEQISAATDARQRAYTLMLRAYDEAQRAVTYLRWHEDDAEIFAPSLWAGRGRRAAVTAPATPTPVTPTPTLAPAPVVDPAGNPLPNVNGAAATQALPAGHQGGSPLAH